MGVWEAEFGTNDPNSLLMGLDVSGRSVSIGGDINGDNIDDLIIGEPFASRVHILFGTNHGFANMSEGFTIFGSDSSDLTGWSVSSAGDVNNDTFADIIIGVPYASRENCTQCGAVYVIYGGGQLLESVYLSSMELNTGYTVWDEHPYDSLGLSVSGAGDFNGDGFDDIVVGALQMNNQYSGAVYVVFGNCAQSSDAVTLKFQGNKYEQLGFMVSGADDVNRDGFGDVLFNTVTSTYLVYGHNHSTSSLRDSAVAIQNGGRILVGAGDVNSDGFSDFILSQKDSTCQGGGCVIYFPRNVTYHVTSSPTSQPPSTRPTTTPTRTPITQAPSVQPSRFPTRPTISPSIAPSGPTWTPSVLPSQPTSRPTSVPQAPSVHPSKRPTCAPTEAPLTERPSIAPTQELLQFPTCIRTSSPSFSSGSKYQPTRVSRGPSVEPTSSPVIVYITTQIAANQSELTLTGDKNYNIHFENVTGTFNITGQTLGRVIYTFTPLQMDNALYNIETFNVAFDVINLEALRSVRAFKDLTIRSGSVIIILSSKQTIHIRNLHPVNITSDHFVFYQPLDSQGNPIHDITDESVGYAGNSILVIIVLCVVTGCGLFSFICFALSLDTNVKEIKRRDTLTKTRLDAQQMKTFEQLKKSHEFMGTWEIRIDSANSWDSNSSSDEEEEEEEEEAEKEYSPLHNNCENNAPILEQKRVECEDHHSDSEYIVSDSECDSDSEGNVSYKSSYVYHDIEMQSSSVPSPVFSRVNSDVFSVFGSHFSEISSYQSSISTVKSVNSVYENMNEMQKYETTESGNKPNSGSNTFMSEGSVNIVYSVVNSAPHNYTHRAKHGENQECNSLNSEQLSDFTVDSF